MREFTVKDLAELLGVSKPTIQRAINAAAIEADREDGQTRYYSFDTAAAISAKVKPEFDFLGVVGGSDVPPHDATQTETPQNQTQNTATTPPNVPPQTETPPQADSMEFMRAMLTTIQEQLAAKDKQIAAYEAQIAMKDKQIEDYSARLAEAMELTRGQQYIAAADKTAGLLEAAANQENEEVIIAAAATGTGEEEPVAPAKKKGFWSKLFGRE
jgi:excisionase family DNA binding protein